ncbi:MAG: hypothetical protein C4293_02480 [Nitrospiraceae bacterium]
MRTASFCILIFSVFVTITLNREPRVTGMSFSPSRVNVSLIVAEKFLNRRGGTIFSYGMSSSSRSDSMIVFPGAKTRAFCTNGPSGYSIAMANSVAMIAPMRMVFPAPMANAKM